jgi:hypothetical protein
MAKWFCLTQVARRIHFGSFPLIGRFVTSVTSTFGRSRYSVGVDLSGIPIPPTPAARKDNRKTLRVLHHSEGLLLLGDHKQKPSAEDAGSFLTRERNSCARKERAPMNSDLNLRAERQPAAVGMVGAVADLSRSNAAWMSVRNLHLQLRFSHEKFRYGSQGGWGRECGARH